MKKFSRKGSLLAASVLTLCIVPLAASAEVQCARQSVEVSRYADESATTQDRVTISFCDPHAVDVREVTAGFVGAARTMGDVMNLLAAVIVASDKPLAELQRQRVKDHTIAPVVSALTPAVPAK